MLPKINPEVNNLIRLWTKNYTLGQISRFMKEIDSIVNAYRNCKSSNQKVALATVVKVDGSAYRRPGARMLVTESGELVGAISGGCLEGDALRKAQTVIFQQKSMVVTYDTTDEDDQKFGIGLGCNGIIQILIEPVDFDDPHNPIALLEMTSNKRSVSWIVTMVSLENQRAEQIGTFGIFSGKEFVGKSEKVSEKLLDIISEKITYYSENQIFNNQNFTESGDLFTFIEPVKPAIRLLLFGAGNDTIPVAKMADLMGWKVILLDGRKNHASKQRFPTVQEILVGPPDIVLQGVGFDPFTVALLMTHNFDYESVILEKLQTENLPYIGILGPRKKTQKLIERLEEKGVQVLTENLFAPLGLDIGAEGSEEIALSVMSEIRAVLNRKNPIHLREKDGPIHG